MSTPVPPRNRGKKKATPAKKAAAAKSAATNKSAPTKAAADEVDAATADATAADAPQDATVSNGGATKTNGTKANASAAKSGAAKTNANRAGASKTSAASKTGAASKAGAKQEWATAVPPRRGGRAGSRPASGGAVPARPSRSGGRPSARQVRETNKRRNRLMTGGIAGGIALVAAVVVVVVVVMGGGNGEVIPPGVNSQPLTVEPPALKVANPTHIKGVVAYDTAGWPTDSHNGPAKDALGHTHVTGPVQYSVTPPVGGDHNAEWMNCGVYDKPVPVERAVHNLEHGAIWITYRPNLPKAEVAKLVAFQGRQSLIQAPGVTGKSRYVDVTPFPGLPAPIVMSSWGFQMRLTSPTDPRMQQFVNTFRYNKTYSPEYQGPCVEGVGTPIQN